MIYTTAYVVGLLQPNEEQRLLLEQCAAYYYQQYEEARKIVIQQLQRRQTVTLILPMHQDDTENSLTAAAYWHCRQAANGDSVPSKLQRRGPRFRTATPVDCTAAGIYVPELGTMPWVPQTGYSNIIGPPLIARQVNSWLVWLPTAQETRRIDAQWMIPNGADVYLEKPTFHHYKWSTLWEPPFLKRLRTDNEPPQPKVRKQQQTAVRHEPRNRPYVPGWWTKPT